VDLIAFANSECSDTSTFQDLVVLEGPRTTIQVPNDTIVCETEMVSLIGIGEGLYDFLWDLGDGNVISGGQAVMSDTINYMYTLPGTYTPTLSVTDDRGCGTAYQASFTIQIVEFEINLDINPGPFCTGDTVDLNAIITSDILLDKQEWNLPGSDQITQAGSSSFATYSVPGMYMVEFVGGHAFCDDTLRQMIQIDAAPAADFFLDSRGDCVPFSVDFTDNSLGPVTNWEWDFGDGNSSTDQNPSHNYTVFQDSFVINLVVSTSAGCADSTNLTIFAGQGVAFNLSPDTSICQGEAVQLNVNFIDDPTGTTYSWIPDPTLSCTDCMATIVSPTVTTTYTFMVDDGMGCSGSQSVTVNVIPIPVISLTDDTDLCLGDSLLLSANGGDDLSSYIWDSTRPGLSCYNDCDDPLAIPQVTTTYVLTIDNGGCVSTDSVTLFVGTAISNFATGDALICDGDVTPLSVNAGNNPVWLNPDGLSCSECPNPNANPTMTTEYIVEVESNDGCPSRDTVTIEVVILGNSAMGNGNFAWSPAADLDNPAISNPIATPTQTTTYTVTVFAGTCSDTSSVTVEVIDKAEIQTFEYTLCIGDTIQIEAIGTATQYMWDPDPTLSNPSVANPLVFPTETTIYTVTGSLGSCTGDTAEAIVNVVGNLEILGPDEVTVFPGQPKAINVSTLNGTNVTYMWSNPEFLSCSGCPNPTIISGNDDFELLLTVVDNDSGCSETKSIRVTVDGECSPDMIVAPNVFSPNEDGINDIFIPQLVLPLEIVSFTVLDRWGGIRYYDTNLATGWDGWSQGQAMDAGVYIYFIEAVCPFDGVPIVKSGDVTLVR
jgi:gliding motility-associated-like protein